MCLKYAIPSEQLWVFSHRQTFSLTSTITDVNLECGTRPEWRNSERELLTFVQSHDGRERPGQPQENKLYLQQKKKNFSLCFSFCINLHQANIKANPTHEHGNIQQEVTSSRFIWRTTTARRFDYRPHCRKTPGWCESVELKLFRSALSHVWVTVRVWELRSVETSFKTKNHRAADSPPGVCVEARVVRFGGGKSH